MTEEDRQKIISNEYSDIIVEYSNENGELLKYENDTINIIDNKYAVVYYPVIRAPQKIIHESGYAILPKLFGLVDSSSLEEMGIWNSRYL